MTKASWWIRFRQKAEQEATTPDLGRAIRAFFAVTVPLVAFTAGRLPLNLTFVVFAAQSVAIVDIRGAYALRLGLLFGMALILAGASTLGGMVSASLIVSVLAAGLISASGGIWRHFTPDYGPPLAISSTLLFLVSVNAPAAATLNDHHGLAALVGGLWGVFLQVANWPIRPQHPLRRLASDSWAAVADLFAAISPEFHDSRSETLRERENALRITLDQTYAALASAPRSLLRQRLEELNLAAARLATRVVALNTALESLITTKEGASFAASLPPLLTSLTNTSRSIAVTVVSRQPAHLATCEVRIQRLSDLIEAVLGQSPQRPLEAAGFEQLRTILRQIDHHLPHVLEVLRSVIDRAGERAAFSLELLDLDTWKLRPLAAAINVSRRVDPALVRFTGRLMVLIMIGVAAFKFFEVPHGYWLPLTMVIVLQPDYGSTRQRAAQRVLGTVAGSIAASLLLWLELPPPAWAIATGLTISFFAYFLKRRYAVAVFFITLALVLLTEAHGPVTLAFSLERIASTLLGGALALGAALIFWPVWERDRLPPILTAAVEANRTLLGLIAERSQTGGSYDETAIAAKRKAEAANSAVFSSLQRMMGDPRNRRQGLERIAACANGNQRVTRALTVMALQLSDEFKSEAPGVIQGFQQIDDTFDQVIAGLTQKVPRLSASSDSKVVLSTLPLLSDASSVREHWILAQLARIETELGAMLLAVHAFTEPHPPQRTGMLPA